MLHEARRAQEEADRLAAKYPKDADGRFLMPGDLAYVIRWVPYHGHYDNGYGSSGNFYTISTAMNAHDLHHAVLLVKASSGMKFDQHISVVAKYLRRV